VTIDPDSSDYVWEQVAALIRQRIGSGRYPPGRALPSSRTLSQELGVSVGSVKHATEVLKADGWLITRIGRGLFVADPLPPRT
jgi:GntR family transcriptional regulator